MGKEEIKMGKERRCKKEREKEELNPAPSFAFAGFAPGRPLPTSACRSGMGGRKPDGNTREESCQRNDGCGWTHSGVLRGATADGAGQESNMPNEKRHRLSIDGICSVLLHLSRDWRANVVHGVLCWQVRHRLTTRATAAARHH